MKMKLNGHVYKVNHVTKNYVVFELPEKDIVGYQSRFPVKLSTLSKNQLVRLALYAIQESLKKD